MIKTIAIDDEPLALSVLESFCSKTDFIELQKTFTKPTEALKYLRQYPVDLIFLDIQMPSVSGLELVKSIQQDAMVIFTTAHSQYAVEGFNLNAIDFLLKPFTPERFQQAANKANDFYQYTRQAAQQNNFLFIRADYSLVKINVNEITYIEGLDDYIKIYRPDQKPLVARMTLKAILEKLPASAFVRVHRSYIVSISRIEKIRNKTILIAGKDIPVSSSYEKTLAELMK